jgi:hypothetical protein
VEETFFGNRVKTHEVSDSQKFFENPVEGLRGLQKFFENPVDSQKILVEGLQKFCIKGTK